MRILFFIIIAALWGCGEETIVIELSPNFQAANDQSAREGDVLVMIEDATLFSEKTTEVDWENNVSETAVDYTPSPPASGAVILENLPSWTALTSGASVRRGHIAIESGGKMYVFGGYDGGSYLNDMWEYDIAGDSWTALTSGATGRSLHTGILYNGKIYIFGGFNGSSTLNDVWEYDISGDSWTALTSGASIRMDHSAIESGGKMYIFGGNTGAGYLNDLWEYDISGDSWSSLTSGATTRRGHSAIEYNGKMLIFAGWRGGANFLNDVWEYDILLDSWTQLASGATTRMDHTAFEYNGQMYIFAGQENIGWMNDLWQYSIAGDGWTQLTSGATIRSNHSAVEYLGKLITFGGYDFAGGWKNDIYEHGLGYRFSGDITTDNIDLGEVPTNDGEWVIEDITPDDSTLTYTAEYSTTGAWGGEEVSIGAITDGLAITVLARYWRVEATFTPSTNKGETPTLQSIRVDYTSYKKFNKLKDLGYEPLVDEVSSLTSKVDLFEPASIGTISVSLVMSDSLSDWVYSDTLFNKIVRVKLGYRYPGFVESDYTYYFTGAIDDWDVDDGILNLQLKDLSKDWKLPVPEKWESVVDDVAYVDEHHINIILDIFQNEINVRDSGLLLDFFAAVKANTPGYKVTRTITKKTEDAKKLVEELRFLLWAYYLPRGDGKIGIKQFDKDEAIQTTFTDDNTVKIEWEANSESLINRTKLYYDWDGLGDDEENFDELDPGDSGTSQTDFRAIVPFKLLDKWTQAAESSQISELEIKILEQFDTMPAKVTVTCDVNQIAIEAGDMVNVTTVNAPGSGGAGIIDEKYLITSKNLDFLGDKIVFEGLKVSV